MHRLINTQHRSVCWREPCPPLYTSQHTDAVLQCAPQMCSHNRTPRLSGSKSDGPAARTSSCCSERSGTLLLLLLCKRLHGMRPEAAGVLGAAGTGKGYSKTPFEPRLSKKKTLREAWGATDEFRAQVNQTPREGMWSAPNAMCLRCAGHNACASLLDHPYRPAIGGAESTPNGNEPIRLVSGAGPSPRTQAFVSDSSAAAGNGSDVCMCDAYPHFIICT
jgi:hypothetical protein